MILDTNAVSALAGAESGLVLAAIGGSQPWLSVVVVGEFRFGILGSKQASALAAWLGELIAETSLLALDLETAWHYADLRNELRRSGRPIPSNDLWICAQARQHDLPVLSRDAHFDHVPGVDRVAW